MDPFTQRMLERARARQEKIDQKLANSGQTVPKRKPLSENTLAPTKKSETSSVKSPIKSLQTQSPVKSPSRRISLRNEQKSVATPTRRDVVVTKKEFNSPKRSNSSRKSDVSVEINIMHREDIQIEVQVEEREAPISVYDAPADNIVEIKELKENKTSGILEKQLDNMDSEEPRSALRRNVKSRLDRLGVLYSDKSELSSPIQRTEKDFTSATPPSAYTVKEVAKTEPKKTGKKFGRLAALADEINNWEDDLSHHDFHPEPVKKPNKFTNKKADESTLDVSIHSYQDINKAITKSTNTPKKTNMSKPVNTRTFSRQSSSKSQKLDTKIVAELEGEGYRRVSAGQSRLVYDFSSSKNADPDRQEPKGASSSPKRASGTKMATMVASSPPVKPSVAKKPSIKKYKAPTPPRRASEDCESEKDKENNVVQREENDNTTDDCVQTKPEPAQEGQEQVIGKGSPVVRRLAPKLNGNVDRNSVLSKAAMFEAGSPKSRDPAEMSLRERKALFEKNKGAAIVPKAPFGLAPSAKSLHGDNKDSKPVRPLTAATNIRTTPTKSTPNNSSKDISGDNISQSSVGGGIRGKLAALFNRENSDTNLGARYRQERDKEMEMLQTRFQYNKNITLPKQRPAESDDEGDPSENAPLMGSTISLGQVHKKPEIIGNIPKVTFEDLKTKSETALHDREGKQEEVDRIVGTQPVKRRSSQDSPVVLSVLEDVKRIKVNTKKSTTVVQQPTSIYPHLSDIETDNSHTQDENSDCGSSDTKEESENLNRSDNWAETSFSREVMKVVKKNSSYTKAINSANRDSSSNIDSDLDDLLDEALNEEDSEGPTPPKVTKNRNSLSSRSFTYKEGSPVKKQFKSPLKVPVTPARTPGDKGNELVHSVSFYRRTQNASSQPTTPIRVIRHESPERDVPTSDQGVTNVTTVRERIKQLQAEIIKQQTIISQASQALNLCAATVEFSGSTEQAEGERLLLLATHRRQACVHEVQRLQVEGAGEAARAGGASLKLQSIRLPLRRDYMRQLNADGAVGHHAVCILKCRDRVAATSMQETKGDSVALFFPDLVVMEGLTSDFKVTIEVYLLQASKEFLPHNVKYHISNKKSSKLLTPRSKGSDLKTPKIQSPAGPMSVRTPQFQPHGYCIFALPQANRDHFTLSKLPAGSPLEGSLQVKIHASIQAVAPKPHSAFLTAFDDISGLGAWHRRWFVLQPPRLSFWKYPDDVQKKMPIGDIDLSTVVSEKAIKAPRDLCARPNTILLETSIPQGLLVPETGSLVYFKRPDGSLVRRHLLAADTISDRDVWIERLNKALVYVRCCGTDD